MAKMHDETKDLRLLSRKCRIDYVNKVINASKTTILGNNSWGRIDYLTHYCGWHFIYDDRLSIIYIRDNDADAKKKKREMKKESKTPKLTNKKNRR